MCIDIVKIWFRITSGEISSIFVRVICPPHDRGGVLSFHVFYLSLFFREDKTAYHVMSRLIFFEKYNKKIKM